MQSLPLFHPTKRPPSSCNTYAGTTLVGFRVDLEFQVISAPKPAGSCRPATHNAQRVAERSACGSARDPGAQRRAPPGAAAAGRQALRGRRGATPSRGSPLAVRPPSHSPGALRASQPGRRERRRAGTAAGTRCQRARGERGRLPGRLVAAAAATPQRGLGCWARRACANAAAAARDSPEVGSQGPRRVPGTLSVTFSFLLWLTRLKK